MEDLSAWTYAEHQQLPFADWLSTVRQLDEEHDHYYEVNDVEASSLLSYFGNMTVSANEFAQTFLSSTFGGNMLQDFRTTKDAAMSADSRAHYLVPIVASLPATHRRVYDLLDAVQALRDDQLSLTNEQMQHVKEWGPIIRLSRFSRELSDHSRGEYFTRTCSVSPMECICVCIAILITPQGCRPLTKNGGATRRLSSHTVLAGADRNISSMVIIPSVMCWKPEETIAM